MREVYGDPDDFHDAWDAPFAVLALQGPTTLFVHPLVEKVYPARSPINGFIHCLVTLTLILRFWISNGHCLLALISLSWNFGNNPSLHS